MKTSSAEANGYRCPKCGDETSLDPNNNGFVRHMNNPHCDFERGKRDVYPLSGRSAAVEGSKPRPTCPTCFMTLPLNGVCGTCS
jgi:ssDNA-binding Zn-finger/Zn-ribbon topoisomerase 1